MRTFKGEDYVYSKEGEDIFTYGINNCLGIAILYKDASGLKHGFLIHFSWRYLEDDETLKKFLSKISQTIPKNQSSKIIPICVGANYDEPDGDKDTEEMKEHSLQLREIAVKKLN